MTEQFTFEQRLSDSGTVDGDERTFCPSTCPVYKARYQFLAGAALALNQHGGIAGREACINAIEHGNKLNETLSVVVTLSMDDESLEVKIRDNGTGVHENAHVRDIDRKMQGEESPRGMGMFLIQALVDEVEYGSEPAGRYARLVIHLNTGGSE
jgi:anti-sigma regulatory factor (Ser/Thr protein kinase)